MEMTKERKLPKIDMSAPDPLATINRSALARHLGISIALASRLFSPYPAQRRRISLARAFAISTYLSISIDELYALLNGP